ncbi:MULTISPECIES: hypothetical protein [Ramlibacter]|uniref:Uncharacterized protein n=1 Tax=Ramlibacter pinisoli TaxID=2682844 RepID=A0A6N8J0N2_9BURK|nr:MULTISPECIES: hypothetical protein [Ramlibacter]MBA2961871.1 hypothetical protein [Ramlibacter sp. CGMCC 1.13660]MVQ31813.1 hypothetical protein [Ramlibacter pinisoli]
MLHVTALSDRFYDIDVWGRTSEPEWRVVAAYTYAVVLEARVGGPQALLKCFQAWDREERGTATASDAVDAEAFRSAIAYADPVGKRLMEPEPPAHFTFRVK